MNCIIYFTNKWGKNTEYYSFDIWMTIEHSSKLDFIILRFDNHYRYLQK